MGECCTREDVPQERKIINSFRNIDNENKFYFTNFILQYRTMMKIMKKLDLCQKTPLKNLVKCNN